MQNTCIYISVLHFEMITKHVQYHIIMWTAYQLPKKHSLCQWIVYHLWKTEQRSHIWERRSQQRNINSDATLICRYIYGFFLDLCCFKNVIHIKTYYQNNKNPKKVMVGSNLRALKMGGNPSVHNQFYETTSMWWGTIFFAWSFHVSIYFGFSFDYWMSIMLSIGKILWPPSISLSFNYFYIIMLSEWCLSYYKIE